MKKKTIPTKIQILTLIGALALTFSTQPIEAEKTIYIRPDGSIDPPTTPIQRNADRYTFTNIIHESIVIQRNNTEIDGNHFALEGNRNGIGFHLQNTRNITIINTQIKNFSQGIYLRNSPNSRIANNIITNCTYAILNDRSSDNTIISNTINDNKWDGIFITASPRSTIINNTVANNGKWGIYLGYSADTKLRNNKMKDNKYNFGVSVDFIHDIDTSNTVNGKPIYYLINQDNVQIPSDSGYVAVINSNNIEMRNLNLNKNGQGLLLVNSRNSIIENSNLTINGYYGIQLINSHYNLISNNTVANNDVGGIALITSTKNTIINNTIKNNDKGVQLSASSNNIVYQNNFVNNAYQVFSQDSTNIWDGGSPSSGNYWSDYKGRDNDGDGTGDTPYIIDKTNRDNYPLMKPVQKISPPSISWQPIFLTIGMLLLTIAAATLAHFSSSMRKQQMENKKRRGFASVDF